MTKTQAQRTKAQLERRARILAQREANSVTRKEWLRCDDLEPGRQIESIPNASKGKRESRILFSWLAWIWPF